MHAIRFGTEQCMKIRKIVKKLKIFWKFVSGKIMTNCKKAKYLVELSPAITCKIKIVPHQFVDLGKMVSKKNVKKVSCSLLAAYDIFLQEREEIRKEFTSL